MPKDEKFWNPYRLIPEKERIERRPPLTDEKFQGNSGMIHCSIKNLTPLFVGKNRYNAQRFLTRAGKEVIPGSSLKGMLRSLSEIVGGGCAVTDQRGQFNKKHAACNRAQSLCIACRMFGMMERGKGARVHRGNVSVSDALIREEHPETDVFEVLLGNCGTRHEPFYRTPATKKLDGKSRKLYFHQPKRTTSVPVIPANIRSRAWRISPLLPGHHFDFDVQFSNLEDKELELLIYALTLENDVSVNLKEGNIHLRGPLRHKLGNAKPLGMGTCQVTINTLTFFPESKSRFSSLQAPRNRVLEGDDLQKEITRLTQAIRNDKSPTMVQLRKMMVWDETDERDFEYPTYYWFKNSENSGKMLKEI